LWKICPIRTEIIVIVIKANIEPPKASNREDRIDSSAAIKNVLSPISDANTKERACKKPPENAVVVAVIASALARDGYSIEDPTKAMAAPATPAALFSFKVVVVVVVGERGFFVVATAKPTGFEDVSPLS